MNFNSHIIARRSNLMNRELGNVWRSGLTWQDEAIAVRVIERRWNYRHGWYRDVDGRSYQTEGQPIPWCD